MPALHELQRDFARYLLGGSPDRLARSVRRDRLAPEARAQIYRNHLRVSLTEALGAAFPVVARLVGPDYFAAAARRFVEAHPPAQPVLAEYGGDFPSFLETLPHAPEYLGDVARLEWALSLSYRAPAAKPLDARDLAALSPGDMGALGLKPHPAARLLVSDYPVHSIWCANQAGAAGGADLGDGGAALLIWRHDGDAMFRPLDASAYRFVAALFAGVTLARAASLALETDPLFDLAATLAQLLGEPIFLDPRPEGDNP